MDAGRDDFKTPSASATTKGSDQGHSRFEPGSGYYGEETLLNRLEENYTINLSAAELKTKIMQYTRQLLFGKTITETNDMIPIEKIGLVPTINEIKASSRENDNPKHLISRYMQSYKTMYDQSLKKELDDSRFMEKSHENAAKNSNSGSR